jgi:hypothetical protein
MDNPLFKKSREILEGYDAKLRGEREAIVTKVVVSQCCGEEMPDYPDRDICPACREHTGVEAIPE